MPAVQNTATPLNLSRHRNNRGYSRGLQVLPTTNAPSIPPETQPRYSRYFIQKPIRTDSTSNLTTTSAAASIDEILEHQYTFYSNHLVIQREEQSARKAIPNLIPLLYVSRSCRRKR
jgi:hypothetical protein